MIYLDNAATTKPFDEVVKAVSKAMEEKYFNASALYYKAVDMESEINRQREKIAAELGRNAKEIIFTSGGTESNNLAILGTFFALRRNTQWHFVTSEVEHPAVFNVFKFIESLGHEVTYLPVNRAGVVSPEALFAVVRPNTALVSVMHVNNETGAVNDLAALSSATKAANEETFFHSDGVQAFMKVSGPLPPHVDSYSVSGHKICGPKGVGALYTRAGTRLIGVMIGGGQEGGVRSGTENVPGIVGLGEAVSIYAKNRTGFLQKMRECRAMLARYITSLEGVTINGMLTGGAPHILSATFHGVLAEHLLHMLEQRGIFVATGSACSSRKKGNRVLEAMGLTPDEAASTLRFSLSPHNTADEIAFAAQEISVCVSTLRRFGRRKG